MADYKEFSRQIKEKYPEYKNVDDLKLAKAMIEKYPVYAEQVSFDNSSKQVRPRSKGVDLTPSGLVKQATAGVAAPFRAAIYNETLPQAYNRAREIQEGSILNQFSPAVDIGTTFLLPEVRAFQGAGLLPRLGNYALTGAEQGAVIGGIEGLKDDGLKGLGIGALQGGGIGAAIGGGLPLAGVPISKGVSWLLPRTGASLGGVTVDTIKQAVKPDSKALDLNAEKAQSLLLDTTKNVRDAYNQLLNNRGRKVGELLQELPEEISFKADDLRNDIDKIYSNYSLSGNTNLNPAINATKKEAAQIENLLYGSDSERAKEFTDAVENAKFDFTPLDTVKGHYKNKFWTKSLDNMNNDITRADRRMNEYIEGIKQYPETIYDPQKIQSIENAINKFTVPDEVKSRYYEKLYEVMSKGDILDKSQKTITPKELYDINKNVSNMTRWDMPDSPIKNDVLEQIYGTYAGRISDLSPELEKANAEYSRLMDFKKNEGIDRILNNRERIDTASQALKNYNSTVTKGNTNRNIQDLEKILTDEGNAPFLNDIDDVNAAMDLENSLKTGRNFLGATDLAKQTLLRPILNAVRNSNRRKLPEMFNSISNKMPRVLTPLLYGGPRLYGGISNSEDEY